VRVGFVEQRIAPGGHQPTQRGASRGGGGCVHPRRPQKPTAQTAPDNPQQPMRAVSTSSRRKAQSKARWVPPAERRRPRVHTEKRLGEECSCPPPPAQLTIIALNPALSSISGSLNSPYGIESGTSARRTRTVYPRQMRPAPEHVVPVFSSLNSPQ